MMIARSAEVKRLSFRAGGDEGAIKIGIQPVVGQQFRMRAAFNDPPSFQDQHLIGVPNGAQAVSDNETGAAAEQDGQGREMVC